MFTMDSYDLAWTNAATRFVSERCTTKPTDTALATPLYQAWSNWLRENRMPATTQSQFGRLFGRIGYTRKRTTGGRYAYLQIGLK